MSHEIAYMSVVELLENYRSKSLSPVDVTQHFLDRIEELNPELNAIYLLRAEESLEEAAASEKRWVEGNPK